MAAMSNAGATTFASAEEFFSATSVGASVTSPGFCTVAHADAVKIKTDMKIDRKTGKIS
jgi:hypothetical protein